MNILVALNSTYIKPLKVRNTVILHFCDKKKPWRKDYNRKFYSLYKHYEKLISL